jgi:peptidoglycan/LPS O-acetylase OafA/YrhL
MPDTAAARPWHLIPVGLLALVWHLGGAADYVATQIAWEPYVGQFPDAWMAYFDAMPLWVDAAWAIGVWVGLLGAVLLLMRERAAVLALALAAVAMAAATFWLLVVSDPPMQDITGAQGVYVMLGAVLVSVLLWIYARSAKTRGALA